MVDTTLLNSIYVPGALTFLISFLSIPLSALCGLYLIYRVKSGQPYGLLLALLFIPFALGSSTWAYTSTTLLSALSIKSELLAAGPISRATALLMLCTARIVPLGAFFVATSLHRYMNDAGGYFKVHGLDFSFFAWAASRKIPRSIFALIGMFSGGLMVSESALPTFLYRANPGTPPETINLLLSHLFMENYAAIGPGTLPKMASLGLLLSAILIVVAASGTLLGMSFLKTWGPGTNPSRGQSAYRRGLERIARPITWLCLAIPGVAAAGLVLSARANVLELSQLGQRAVAYDKIALVAVVVATLVMAVSIIVAIALRFGKSNLVQGVGNSFALSVLLMAPAFLPILSVVAGLSTVSNYFFYGPLGYVAIVFCHFTLHYPVYQFMCLGMIASVPASRVKWQRSVRMKFTFSLVVDGFLRNRAALLSLVGLCAVEVVTDGSVSRWFSNLVQSPEEALYGAIFGRAADSSEALLIVCVVSLSAVFLSSVLGAIYARNYRYGQRHV